MNEPTDPIPAVVEARLPQGRPLIAWAVIALLVVGQALLANLRPVTKDPENHNRVQLVLFQLQGRYLIGATDLMRSLDSKQAATLYREAQQFNTGPLPQRLRFVVLAGELAGPEEARRQLNAIQDRLAASSILPTTEQAALMRTLGRLYDDFTAEHYDAPTLTQADRDRLRTDLGWFGELALAPANGPNPETRDTLMHAARVTALTMLGAFLGGGTLAILGLVGLALLLASWSRGRARDGLAWRSPFAGIYAETFAVWMLLFLLLSIAAGFIPASESRLLLAGLAMLGSLSALAWPVLRGVPWVQVRNEVGWTAGRRPWLEPFLGVATYAMSLPLLGIGVLLIFLLLMAQKMWLTGAGIADPFNPTEMPSHPVIEFVAGPGWWGKLQVLFVASVVAPIVEETMFRGVLHRHLRDTTSRLGFGWSVLLSGLLVSFVFAVIHPQGVIAVPGLMALALGFTLAREWRGTLIPAMVAHGINNGVLMLLLILALS